MSTRTCWFKLRNVLGEPEDVFADSSMFNLTHNPEQAVVLWGADSGTRPGQGSTFLSTNSSSTPTTPPFPPTSTVAGSNMYSSTLKAMEPFPSVTQPPTQPVITTLSPCTKAGIGIGGGFTAVLLVACVWLYARLRQHVTSQGKAAPVSEEPRLVTEPVRDESQEIGRREQIIELDSAAGHELDGAAQHELEARGRRNSIGPESTNWRHERGRGHFTAR